MTSYETDELCWKNYAIKEGYLIEMVQLKMPQMRYFVLTACGLVSFEVEPKCDTEPLCFLPYEQLSSIKLDCIELNSIELSCIQLTSKTTSSLVLGFNRKKDRDEWMTIMMKAFSESLSATPAFTTTSSSSVEDKPATNEDNTKETHSERTNDTGSYAQSVRRKRRKGDNGSIRGSKSLDTLVLHNVTNATFKSPTTTKLLVNPHQPETGKPSQTQSRKRKSEPDILDQISSAQITNIKEKRFANSCSFEHRDSLTVQAEKQIKSQNDSLTQKSNIFAKLRLKLEYPKNS